LRHARAALAHGGDDATAFAVAALTILHIDHDFEAASGAVARAVSLNGSCATAFYLGAHVHALSGDAAIAEDYAARALRLSPFDPFGFMALYSLGMVRVRERRFDEAAALCSKSVQANPRFSTLYAFQTAILADAGRDEEATSVARRLLELEPNFHVRPFLGFFSGFSHKAVTESLSAGLRKVGLPE
jgi:adenylate cyclase